MIVIIGNGYCGSFSALYDGYWCTAYRCWDGCWWTSGETIYGEKRAYIVLASYTVCMCHLKLKAMVGIINVC